ncbi:MAG: glycosyltransferase WbsX family protein [Cetobacterium sp.]
MKIIAYYLPQFHSTVENDKWWGKGFTEWDNVKNAKSLYEGHEQPKIPLNDNYYNLMNKETMEWQSELAEKYLIYGFCYYHYWFKGRKMLEKPLENLLEWRDIKQKYCFCWANHDWKRTWDGTDELLIKQEYGLEKDWEEHFEYLLNYFNDERYIKKDGKPIFIIYDPLKIPKCDEMISFWEKMAKKSGLKGIYIIESLNNKRNEFLKKSSAVVLREPMYSRVMKNNLQIKVNKIIYSVLKKIKMIKIVKNVKRYNYDNIWNKVIRNYEKLNISKKEIYQGSFINWDNTPRHKMRGSTFDGFTLQKFEKNLFIQKKLAKKNRSEYIFFNAWNEWAEGMYLEPDKKSKNNSLKTIKKVIED